MLNHGSQKGLVQTGSAVGDDEQMPRFIPVEELFKGRHFDQEIVIFCVRWGPGRPDP
ncbi:MAG: hypothetical protein JO091_00525 [Acidobacteriaceae bacterium]|nr:hypothetical protein [Acidobacteriaceae bacterium]